MTCPVVEQYEVHTIPNLGVCLACGKIMTKEEIQASIEQVPNDVMREIVERFTD